MNESNLSSLTAVKAVAYAHDAAQAVVDVDSFKEWIRGAVRQIIPHGVMACGYGRVNAAGVSMDYVITVDYPIGHLAAIRNASGGIDTPIMRRWFQQRTPIIFEADIPWREVSAEWLGHFRRHELLNPLVHAEYDTTRCVGTYFSFHRLPDIGPRQCERLQLLLPLLHESLIGVIAHLENSAHPLLEALSQREREIANLIGRGKTNAEIATAAFLSENTVKHYVTAILQKTRVDNRAALAALVSRQVASSTPGDTRVL